MTSWPAFVDAFAHIAERDLTKPATIAELNCAFGSRAVRWTGTVHSIRLGPHPLITIEMPASGESAAFRRLGLIHAHLRWAGRLGAPGLWTQGSATPQILTSVRYWREVRPANQIEFIMMFAPGLEDQISCVQINDFGDRSDYAIHTCGIHLLRIISEPRGGEAKPP